jgi:glutathione S-transferase
MTRPAQPIRLHGFPLSGHCHRVQLFLALLQLPAEMVAVDLPGGAHKAPDFLALNPFGQVPVIEDGEHVVADSNAILVYLASRYDRAGSWYPRDPQLAAEVQRWLSVAAGPLASGPARARLAALFGLALDVAQARSEARQLFAVLDAHLAARDFLVGAAPTIADIALYTYTAHAPEGGIPLDPYPHLRAWLARVEALPGFVGMQRAPTPAAA